MRGGRYPRSRANQSGLFSLVLALGLAAAAAFLLEPASRTLEGQAQAPDGDSLRIGETRIRLEGIDAPELDQTCQRSGRPYVCGEAARDALRTLVQNGPVTCRSEGRDKYKRTLARCRIGDLDLGASLVSAGWAVAYGGYESEQRQAKTGRLGLWAGTFDAPREWRRLHPRTP